VNFAEAVAARRSVRAFQQRRVPQQAIERAIGLAVQAPAPHHSQPWRFVVVGEPGDKDRLSRVMGDAWREDLAADGLPEEQIEAITSRSHHLLMSTPVLVVCCADTTKAHEYRDERRRRAEWSLFAHSVGAALQIFMTSLATEEIASCWISAPVFCGDVVRDVFGLAPSIEPHALVLVGYASPDYRSRPRPQPNPARYTISAGNLDQ
jgi:coenzyme F420-0:L-glutamate ligase/coenzyme F420-1:gamma-L-glutamate ligase